MQNYARGTPLTRRQTFTLQKALQKPHEDRAVKRAGQTLDKRFGIHSLNRDKARERLKALQARNPDKELRQVQNRANPELYEDRLRGQLNKRMRDFTSTPSV